VFSGGSSGTYSGDMPPQWLTSAVSDYVILAVCLVGFGYALYRERKKQ
jgi:hypothetical protein